MADYLIQDKTMTVMADHMRRISGTSNTLSGGDIAELFSRTQGTVKTDGEYLVEAFGYDGTVVKSGNYDTGEVFAMPKDTYSYGNSWNTDNILEFDSWVSTSPMYNNYCVVDNSPIHVGAIMKPIDDSMVIGLETVESNTEIEITLTLYKGDIIDWGDGTINTISSQYEQANSHIYTNIGSYIIKIYCNNDNKNYHITTHPIYDSIKRSLIKCICIPSWIDYIYGRAFENTSNLTTITFANGVYFDRANELFNGCSSLEYVVFPSSITKSQGQTAYAFLNSGVKKVILPYGITCIPERCFGDCTNLTDIIIPDSVNTIYNQAFYGAGITKLVIPDSVRSIGNYAFAHNTNLEELIIPKGVVFLGEYIISGCKKLSKLTIEEGISNIDNYSFATSSLDGTALANIPNINTITLPSTVKSIGSYAFYYLRYLSTIVIKSDTVCSLGDYAFTNTYIDILSSGSIFVQDSLVDSYKTASNWSTYASKIKPLSEYYDTH